MREKIDKESSWRDVQEEKIDERIDGLNRAMLIEDMLLSMRVLGFLDGGELYDWHLNRANYIAERLGVAPYEKIDTDNN